ncbi:MAG: hypothetical protein LBC59_06595 [Chitinispirillales bacterium]|jgi:hypothetical protein|nr:hypothetical protein [Chitinispirillales bacterium]
MQLSQEQMVKLLKGNYTFSLWSMSMLITRLKGVYANDSSPSSLEKCTGEMNVFVNKFKSVMGNDYAVLQKL